MKKSFIFIYVLSFSNLALSSVAYDEFLELAEPQKNISGAYYGVGATLSRMSHSINVKQVDSLVNFKKASNQIDFSLIGGFGAPFYKRYYAGIEFDFFKRFPGGKAYKENIGIMHSSGIGLNMDVRFGYLFPEQGLLVYTTFGFARVIGNVIFYSHQRASFGSFYPTFGTGIEYKINHRWNVRGDFRISVTSKNDRSFCDMKYEGRPNRMAFRISITRSI